MLCTWCFTVDSSISSFERDLLVREARVDQAPDLEDSRIVNVEAGASPERLAASAVTRRSGAQASYGEQENSPSLAP